MLILQGTPAFTPARFARKLEGLKQSNRGTTAVAARFGSSGSRWCSLLHRTLPWRSRSRAMELLGAPVFPHVVIVCVLANLLTGHRSIYPAQRLVSGNGGTRLATPVPPAPPREERR